MWKQCKLAYPILFTAMITAQTAHAQSYFAIGEMNHLPLILSSENLGKSWLQHKVTGLPKDYLYSELSTAECSTDSCIAGGVFAYNDSHGDMHPMIIVSHDKGESWEFSSLPLIKPKNDYFFKSTIKSVKCQNNYCFSLGYFEGSARDVHPIFMQSFDKGKSWSLKTDLPANIVEIMGSHCNFSMCVIAATQYDKPFISLSTDEGKTWKTVEAFNNLPVISNPKSESDRYNWYTTKLQCTNNYCFAIGSYYTQGAPGRPFLLVGESSGKKWAYVDPATVAGNVKSLTHISCSDYECVISGRNENNEPLILTTEKFLNGKFLEVRLLPDPWDIRSLMANTCYKNVCIVSGALYKRNQSQHIAYPYIIRSGEGHGLYKWEKSSISGMPDNLFSVEMRSIKCYDNSCVIIGSTKKEQEDYKPMILTSNNLGKTWTYNTSVNLPKTKLATLTHN